MDLATAAASTPEERSAAFRLRHEVFVRELGFRIAGSDERLGLIEPEDEQAYLILGCVNGEPAGTVTNDWWARTELSAEKVSRYRLREFEPFGRESVFLTRKAAVAQRFRHGELFMRLVIHAAQHIVGHPEARFGFIESAPEAIPLYERFGYRRYAPSFIYPDGSEGIPLCFFIDDHAYLRSIDSPVLPVILANGHTERRESGSALAQRLCRTEEELCQPSSDLAG